MPPIKTPYIGMGLPKKCAPAIEHHYVINVSIVDLDIGFIKQHLDAFRRSMANNLPA